MNLLELEQAVNTNKQNIDFDTLRKELSDLESKLQTPEVWSIRIWHQSWGKSPERLKTLWKCLSAGSQLLMMPELRRK